MPIGRELMTKFAYIAMLSFALLLPSVVNAESVKSDKAQNPGNPYAWNQNDFRGSKWGDSIKDVKDAEKAPVWQERELEDNKHYILYYGKLNNMEMQVGYIFQDRKLERAGYFLNEKFINSASYISAYKKLKKELEATYGPPATDEVIWTEGVDSKQYEGNPQKIADAACEGKVVHFVVWNTEGSQIKLSTHGENNACKLGLIFTSNELMMKESLGIQLTPNEATSGPDQPVPAE